MYEATRRKNQRSRSQNVSGEKCKKRGQEHSTVLQGLEIMGCSYRAKPSGLGTSLAVQWLRLRASNAGGASWIPGRDIKIPHATG